MTEQAAPPNLFWAKLIRAAEEKKLQPKSSPKKSSLKPMKKTPSPVKLAVVRSSEETQKTRTCDSIVQHVVDLWIDQPGSLPNLDLLAIDAEAALIEQEPEIAKKMAIEILAALEKQPTRSSATKSSVSPTLSFLRPSGSSPFEEKTRSSPPSAILAPMEPKPNKKKILKKKAEEENEEIELEDVGLEDYETEQRRRRVVKEKIDEVYEAALSEFNKIENPTDDQHVDFVNEVVEDVENILRDAGSPGVKFLEELAQELMPVEWDYTPEDIKGVEELWDEAIQEYISTLILERVREKYPEQVVEALAEEEEKFYDDVLQLIKASTPGNTQPLIHFIKEYMRTHPSFVLDRQLLRQDLLPQNKTLSATKIMAAIPKKSKTPTKK